VRYVMLVVAAYVLSGCSADVVMVNPRNGETTTCPASPWNPWSQQEACIGDHTAQGWKRQE
jgi:uncharacterized protein YceK